MKKNNKKLMIIIAGILLVTIGVVTAVVLLTGKEEPAEVVATPPPKKKKVTAPLNIIAIDQRPVFRLLPFVSNGKNLKIEIDSLPMTATEGEYEIEYTIGGATAKSAGGGNVKVPDNEPTEGLQGFVGEMDISKLPFSTEKMLGSCSAGGACIYHSGITDGKITLRFAGPENYAVQSAFTYFENGLEENETIDKKFTIASADLEGVQDFLIVEQMGLQAGLPGANVTRSDESGANANKVVAYGVYFNEAITADTVEVTFSDIGDATGLVIWDGSKWEVVEDAVIADGTLTAETALAEVYALIK